MSIETLLGDSATLVETPDQYPTGEHSAIIVFETNSYTIPGDERSRKNPGHGYPERTVEQKLTKYYAFADEWSWEKAIKAIERHNYKESQRYDYRAFRVPCVVTTEVFVEVQIMS